MVTKRASLSVAEYLAGVRGGDRAILGRAITLMESTTTSSRQMASSLLAQLMPHTGKSLRLGVTGVPGVGKSTFIEALGLHLTSRGNRVAVLTIDPSSGRSGGSILGDKTRMERLSHDANAFIRPSPSLGTLGGVASKTREAVLCCEAANYNIILIETVGVGQSELAVADMTDFFLLLMLPGAGDELQGIKRGVMERADMLVVNKADGDQMAQAKEAAATYRRALHYLQPRSSTWQPLVLTCSSLDVRGIDEVWSQVDGYYQKMRASGEFQALRQNQNSQWMWSAVEEELSRELREDVSLEHTVAELEGQVKAGKIPPPRAARELLGAFFQARVGEG